MNPFTYLWNRYKETHWHIFHKELWRGWKLNSRRNKFFDVSLLVLGILIMLLDRTATGVGYMILVLLVLGQGWIINCYANDLRSSHNAFLVVLRMLHDERTGKSKSDEDNRS